MNAGDRVRVREVVRSLEGESGYGPMPGDAPGTVTAVHMGVDGFSITRRAVSCEVAWDEPRDAAPGKAWRIADLEPAPSGRGDWAARSAEVAARARALGFPEVIESIDDKVWFHRAGRETFTVSTRMVTSGGRVLWQQIPSANHHAEMWADGVSTSEWEPVEQMMAEHVQP